MKLLARILAFSGVLLAVMSAAVMCDAQDGPETAAATDASRRVDFAQAPGEEQRILSTMAESEDWAFRALALMRLARYEGDEVRGRILAALEDPSWQVRCFAIRNAWLHRYEVDPQGFEDESDARVIRAAIQHGLTVPESKLTSMLDALFKERTVDALMLGIEIGAAAPTDALRRECSRRTLTLIRNMSPQIAAVVGRRLSSVLRLNPAPENLAQWHQWAGAQNPAPGAFLLPPPVSPEHLRIASSAIAAADEQTFARLRDYLSVLRQRDLELVVLMDSTTSMSPIIDAVKADVDALMLFLSDISSTLRLGICAYRDYDNPGRLIEAHPLSTDLESLRNFLFGLQTPGGPTYPEAVFAGLNACRQYDWRREAQRQIILIGDAPPNEQEMYDTRRILEWYREQDFTVHAVHAPMQWREEYLRSLPPARFQQQQQWLLEYNTSTRETFREMAGFGGGQLVELDQHGRHELVRSVMKLTIEREWWAYFDDFYDAYLDLCR